MTDVLIGGFGPLHGENSRGIEHCMLRLDAQGAPLTRDAGSGRGAAEYQTSVLADVPSPSWLERDGDMLYAVLEDSDEIASLRLEGAGETLHAELLGAVPSAGRGPTHAVVGIDAVGNKHLIVANYVDGVVGVHPIAADGGVLPAGQVLQGTGRGPLPAQDGPHAHWALPLPDGRVLTTDLGFDRVYVHRWQGDMLVRVGAVVVAPGTGPRDMHLLPGRGSSWRVAVVGEWANTVTILAPVFDLGAADGGRRADDGIDVAQTIELGGKADDQAASLAFVPGGEESFGTVCVGLRGSDRIISLRWDGEWLSRYDAEIAKPWTKRGVSSMGGRPRHICALGRLLLVANEFSDTLAVFSVAGDGEPKPVASIPAGSPSIALPW